MKDFFKKMDFLKTITKKTPEMDNGKNGLLPLGGRAVFDFFFYFFLFRRQKGPGCKIFLQIGPWDAKTPRRTVFAQHVIYTPWTSKNVIPSS
jgi:hypothetical protein